MIKAAALGRTGAPNKWKATTCQQETQKDSKRHFATRVNKTLQNVVFMKNHPLAIMGKITSMSSSLCSDGP